MQSSSFHSLPPFFLLLAFAVAIIWIFPDIVTYLPRRMLGMR